MPSLRMRPAPQGEPSVFEREAASLKGKAGNQKSKMQVGATAAGQLSVINFQKAAELPADRWAAAALPVPAASLPTLRCSCYSCSWCGGSRLA